MMARGGCFALALALLVGVAQAQDADDLEALSLVPAKAPAPAAAGPWQLFVEGGAGRDQVRDARLMRQSHSTQRLSLDLQVDAGLAKDVRAVLAHRFDLESRHGFAQRKVTNTLKDAYLAWQPRPNAVIDLGRINQYSGVAIGYNPTDFFREGSLRSLTTVDPTLIKKNRQGSVMVRSQLLWDAGSLTGLYSPGLSGGTATPSVNVDWDATNRRDRSLLIFSHWLTKDLNPQWLLYQEQGGSPQLGLNLTKLVNDGTVVYLEWAGGRRPSLLAQSLGQRGDEAFRSRAAVGATYTTRGKLSVSLEAHYNGAGLKQSQWELLPFAWLPAHVSYRQFAQWAQDLPTRHEVMLYASWPDIIVNNLVLAAMVRRNVDDRSRLQWADLRYRWPRDEVAVQWVSVSGAVFTMYGDWPTTRAWALSYRHYF
jgi:hypothetical protein